MGKDLDDMDGLIRRVMCIVMHCLMKVKEMHNHEHTMHFIVIVCTVITCFSFC